MKAKVVLGNGANGGLGTTMAQAFLNARSHSHGNVAKNTAVGI
jgi:hypothetical protein